MNDDTRRALDMADLRSRLAAAIARGYEPDHAQPNRHDYRAADEVIATLGLRPVRRTSMEGPGAPTAYRSDDFDDPASELRRYLATARTERHYETRGEEVRP